MARHRVIPFDQVERHPELKRIIPPTDPKYPAIKHRMLVTFAKTILGYLLMGALCALALWGFGFGFSAASLWHIIGWGGLFWIGFPVVMWWYCAQIALILQKAGPADLKDPRQARVRRCIDEVFAESGMSHQPPLYVSAEKLPNAFATGPIHRKAVVAVTAGFLELMENLSDDEIKGVLAHELGHVRNYDVALNSLISVFSMIFFLIMTAGVYGIISGIGFLRRLLGIGKGGFFSNLLSNIFMFPMFWLCSQVTKVIQLFVVRSRESGADATGAYITGNPCALATALEKLVDYIMKHRPKPGSRDFAFFQVLRPMMIVDPLFDNTQPPPKPKTLWQRIKAFWLDLQLTHPPVPERVAELERMNGGKCPTV